MEITVTLQAVRKKVDFSLPFLPFLLAHLTLVFFRFFRFFRFFAFFSRFFPPSLALFFTSLLTNKLQYQSKALVPALRPFFPFLRLHLVILPLLAVFPFLFFFLLPFNLQPSTSPSSTTHRTPPPPPTPAPPFVTGTVDALQLCS
ncbi:hypothetical protein H112_07666 [Trichophyton rubrum D6]|uniref:Uncharacterized protein n=2 Tax=Trichophyton rubrum TaxID=5551 RepID=A0A087PFK2_TRIRC|nr:uncharacterized protein TERG_11535 [Trichophyton rubrum CBS 118892]EZF11251.1 hypothetical protein H100_07691 [Trichophyton rubrum MR850]EZF38116.1 hypothetical protein H102_07656 [Trichophyton rubrum CBS 100081]EZF48755.1 hypothetical protein H103_07679 [Trichophyton rubrum CBS 288.86]EZF59453.1 hypothetical protein H104_07627 [Trichophyton rubrum CBS 289.86]EZF80687.1 hypothetical protein H110_07676 [Trichophyton rubrum MR1448]EZF91335.1 hypothetical protein H113_07737 [Trichophyton rubr